MIPFKCLFSRRVKRLYILIFILFVLFMLNHLTIFPHDYILPHQILFENDKKSSQSTKHDSDSVSGESKSSSSTPTTPPPKDYRLRWGLDQVLLQNYYGFSNSLFIGYSDYKRITFGQKSALEDRVNLTSGFIPWDSGKDLGWHSDPKHFFTDKKGKSVSPFTSKSFPLKSILHLRVGNARRLRKHKKDSNTEYGFFLRSVVFDGRFTKGSSLQVPSGWVIISHSSKSISLGAGLAQQPFSSTKPPLPKPSKNVALKALFEWPKFYNPSTWSPVIVRTLTPDLTRDSNPVLDSDALKEIIYGTVARQLLRRDLNINISLDLGRVDISQDKGWPDRNDGDTVAFTNVVHRWQSSSSSNPSLHPYVLFGHSIIHIEACRWHLPMSSKHLQDSPQTVVVAGHIHYAPIGMARWVDDNRKRHDHVPMKVTCMFDEEHVKEAVQNVRRKEEGNAGGRDGRLEMNWGWMEMDISFYDRIFTRNGRYNATSPQNASWEPSLHYITWSKTFSSHVRMPHNWVSKPFQMSLVQGDASERKAPRNQKTRIRPRPPVYKQTFHDVLGQALNTFSRRNPSKRVVSACLSPVFGESGVANLKQWLAYHIPRHVDFVTVYGITSPGMYYRSSRDPAKGFERAFRPIAEGGGGLDLLRKITWPYEQSGQVVVKVWEGNLGTDGLEGPYGSEAFYHSQHLMFVDCLLTQHRSSDYILVLDADDYLITRTWRADEQRDKQHNHTMVGKGAVLDGTHGTGRGAVVDEAWEQIPLARLLEQYEDKLMEEKGMTSDGSSGGGHGGSDVHQTDVASQLLRDTSESSPANSTRALLLSNEHQYSRGYGIKWVRYFPECIAKETSRGEPVRLRLSPAKIPPPTYHVYGYGSVEVESVAVPLGKDEGRLKPAEGKQQSGDEFNPNVFLPVKMTVKVLQFPHHYPFHKGDFRQQKSVVATDWCTDMGPPSLRVGH